MKIIGREKERKALKSYFESGVPEFLAVYGRRTLEKAQPFPRFFQKCKI